MTDTPAHDVMVTEADREAAREICRWAYPKLAEAGDGIAAGRNDTHPMVKLVARHRLSTQSAMQARIEEALASAYLQGATDVHSYWVENPGEAPRGDPEFGEAASDYAKAALGAFDSSARATLSNIGSSNDG